MAIANVTAYLSGSNTCVRPGEDVSFDLAVSNNTSSSITPTNVELMVSPAGVAAYRGVSILPPFINPIAGNSVAHYGFTQRFNAVGDVSQGHYQISIACTFYDSAADIAVSNVVTVSLYPLQPVYMPIQAQPGGIGMPALPAAGQSWFESDFQSGLFAAMTGVV